MGGTKGIERFVGSGRGGDGAGRGTDYPGVATVQDWSEQACYDRFEAFVGVRNACYRLGRILVTGGVVALAVAVPVRAASSSRTPAATAPSASFPNSPAQTGPPPGPPWKPAVGWSRPPTNF